ncbi:MAG: transposase [Paludibacteraceae bacterium]|nr:transposase [Paludibacteraceae bacterium]
MSELEYTENGWRLTTDIKRHHRDNQWDYRGEGVYLITIATAERYPLFGELDGNEMPEMARIVLNPLGKQIDRIIRDLPDFYADKGIALKILAVQVMPDHLHFVLQVVKPMEKSVGEIIRSLKSAGTAIYKKDYTDRSTGGPGRKNATERDNSSGSGGKNAAEGDNRIVGFGRIFAGSGSIWEHNPAGYHERLLRGRGQLDAMIRYVKDNPRRLALKRANPDLFRIRQQTILGGVSCTSLGNMFLADYPRRAVLQCSRRLTQTEIDAKREECMKEAAHGTVFISGAISEGEKQISRALREAGYPLVILLTEGFPAPDSPHYKYYKPQGVYFEACAAGKLLLVQPDKEALERADIVEAVTAKVGKIPHESQRYRFVAMNVIAGMIVTAE